MVVSLLINEISKKLYSPKLFYDLEFATLTNTLTIDGSRINVPQMEIQTREVDFFVEGHIDKVNSSNIWLSVPLDNLLGRKNSLESRPYDESGRKIYIEISPNRKGRLKKKIRFTKRKFYKQRGLNWKNR